MKKTVFFLSCAAALASHAATMASQPWTTNRIAEAEARLAARIAAATNGIPSPDYSTGNAALVATIEATAPAPGDYATVSNRAMTALQSHQSLEPATNYTDSATNSLATGPIYGLQQAIEGEGGLASRVLVLELGEVPRLWNGIWDSAAASSNYTDSALGAFAGTGSVARAAAYGTDVRWTDATGCVWGAASPIPSSVTLVGRGDYQSLSQSGGIYKWGTSDDDCIIFSAYDSQWQYYNSMDGAWLGTHEIVSGSQTVTLTSPFNPSSTVQISFFSHMGESSYVGRVALTNDIPEVGPSAPAWDVAALDHIVWTNGMVDVTFSSTLSVVTNGWPDGASVFLRLHPSSDSYIPADPLRLVGYGTWPTNAAQAVAWRSGTNVFVNVILEEMP